MPEGEGRTMAEANAKIVELEKQVQHRNTFQLPTLAGVSKAISSLPLKDEQEVLLVFLREVMKPGQLAATLPSCNKINNIALSNCITLARGFDFLSKTSDSNEDAVGKYLDKFPVMRNMQERHPVLEEVSFGFMSMRVASDGKKYVAVRLFGGALLSTFDLITDIYMIWTYFATGEDGFAIAILIFLPSNIFLQLAIVFFQNRKQTKSRLYKEMMYVVTITKPGMDAYRVVIDAEPEVGAALDPKVEMIYAKCCELFTEAIPGALIQTYAFLVGSNQSNAAIFSLIVSIFTASFTATGASFDLDLDKLKRAATPDFHRFVPDGMKKKVKVFMSMLLVSACQLSAKALACALYSEEGEARELTMVFNATQVYGMVSGLLVVQVATFFYFLKNINPDFINTFYSTKSGNENTMGFFLNHDDDEIKIGVFDDNLNKWKKIEDDVVTWVNEKIPEWNEEQPE
ncbi:hypothetical protein TL16_g05648 [Triparma laevis f. inornata]|uniref:Uncharacterized protein n=1 Tax=Triparma laevis f. inornata TaxID=1714386 RepID=A0A9W7AP95_9STRA|nr:hypothetical protein TL16_g05648 [Triparma laevis f. inornata]